MALLVPNNGEGDGLNYFVNNGTPQNLVLKLYKNNITPAETDVAATYTVADFTGYADFTLTGASWVTVEGAPTSTSYAQQTFTSSAGSQNQSIYGYYMVRASSGRIAVAERFTDGPYVIVNNQDTIKITPTITLD